MCLLVLFRVTGFKMTTRLFIGSLTVSNLGIGIGIMPIVLSKLLPGWKYGGDIGCTIHLIYLTILNLTSFSFVLALSVDRYLAISKPLHYQTIMTFKRGCIATGVIWLVNTMFVPFLSLVVFEASFEYSPHISLCMPTYNGRHITLFFLVALAITTVIVLIGHYKAIKITQKHLRYQHEVGQVTLGNVDVSGLRKNTKAFKTCLIISGTFIVCWMPTSAVYTFIAYNNIQTPDFFGLFKYIIAVFFVINFSINWLNVFIYGWRNKEFRKVAKNICD